MSDWATAWQDLSAGIRAGEDRRERRKGREVQQALEARRIATEEKRAQAQAKQIEEEIMTGQVSRDILRKKLTAMDSPLTAPPGMVPTGFSRGPDGLMTATYGPVPKVGAVTTIPGTTSAVVDIGGVPHVVNQDLMSRWLGGPAAAGSDEASPGLPPVRLPQNVPMPPSAPSAPGGLAPLGPPGASLNTIEPPATNAPQRQLDAPLPVQRPGTDAAPKTLDGPSVTTSGRPVVSSMNLTGVGPSGPTFGRRYALGGDENTPDIVTLSMPGRPFPLNMQRTIDPTTGRPTFSALPDDTTQGQLTERQKSLASIFNAQRLAKELRTAIGRSGTVEWAPTGWNPLSWGNNAEDAATLAGAPTQLSVAMARAMNPGSQVGIEQVKLDKNLVPLGMFASQPTALAAVNRIQHDLLKRVKETGLEDEMRQHFAKQGIKVHQFFANQEEADAAAAAGQIPPGAHVVVDGEVQTNAP